MILILFCVQEFQQRLNLPPERFQIVDDAVQLVGQKYKLWKSLKDWTQSVETWREQIFRWAGGGLSFPG